MPVSITPENYEKELYQSDKPVVLDVFADWCGPCQQMMPIVEELEKELSSTYKFAKLNVDEARDVATKFGVTSVPTFIFIKNGEVIGKDTGYMPKDVLKEKIESVLG